MSYFAAGCSLLWSCLVCCVFVLCLFLFCILIPPGCCSQDLAIWLDWVHYTAQSFKLWFLKLRPDLQRSHWLVLLLCSPAKRCPGLTSAILLFSSRLPFPTVWTLTSALLISVLSINVTPLINSACGSLSSILLWQNPDT